jgi:hypothetical protein
MPSKLTYDSIKAEIGSLDRLIEESELYGDFVATSQFKYKHDELTKELNELADKKENSASVALFFSGKPVYGSVGINSDFAGKALESFQEMISKIFAVSEIGSQSKKGPVAFSSQSKLAITEVSRGSFGFILNEIVEQESFIKTELKHVLENLTHILDMTVSQDESDFDDAIQTLDKRSMQAINKFFKNLDSNEATLRLVEGNSEHLFSSSSIKLGRSRIENTKIQEYEEKISGTLIGFLPESRRFELTQGNELISGSVSKAAVNSFKTILDSNNQTLNRTINANMEIRRITKIGQEPRSIYRLLDFELID